MEYLKPIELSIYPTLWTWTIGVYLLFALSFFLKTGRIKLFISSFLPGWFGSMLTFIFVVSALILPIMFGPFLCLIAWVLLFLLILPEKKLLPVLGSLVFILWGAGIPVKEQLSIWLHDVDIQAAVANLENPQDKEDQEWKYVWLLDERPDDVLVKISYSRFLRQHKRFDDAHEVLNKTEELLSAPEFFAAERGIIEFLRGDIEKADNYFSQAEAMGYDNADFAFNYSKIKFELMDVAASKKYFEKALSRDRDLTRLMQDREDELGSSGVDALVEHRLPAAAVVSSLYSPVAGVRHQVDNRFKNVAPQVLEASEMYFFGLGLMLLVCTLLIRRRPEVDWEDRRGESAGFSIVFGLFFFLSAISLPLLFWPQVTDSPLAAISIAMKDNLPLLIGM